MTHPDRERLRSMFDERFVLVKVQGGANIECWGILYDDFVPLWARTNDDWSVVIEELGQLHSAGLMQDEAQGAVDADDTNTPDEAWAALAHYRLTGERICERRLANGDPEK